MQENDRLFFVSVYPKTLVARCRRSVTFVVGQPSARKTEQRLVFADQRLEREREELSQTFASWNQMVGWLRQIDGLRGAT